MGPGTLAQVLRPLAKMFLAKEYPNLLVGLEVSDDAAVYRISDELAIVLTLDFFAPVVDDPYDYGAIAAANAMSDVYAMGGEVVLALNICGFPIDLPSEMVGEILRGGAEKVAEAGAALAGGHTVIDKEPKYGLAVVGFVHPDHIATKAAAQAGDVLVLTKPLGVGIITTAAKGDQADPAHLNAAIQSMMQLNRRAAELAQQVSFHAITDITGFALLGHGSEMANQSGARLRFELERLPFLEGAQGYADLWLFPAGTCNNERTFEEHVTFHGIADEMQQLLYTPETSGGLLIALPPAEADRLAALYAAAGQPAWRVGEVVAGAGVEVLP